MLLRDIIDLDATYGAGASDTASDAELEVDVVSEPVDGEEEGAAPPRKPEPRVMQSAPSAPSAAPASAGGAAAAITGAEWCCGIVRRDRCAGWRIHR